MITNNNNSLDNQHSSVSISHQLIINQDSSSSNSNNHTNSSKEDIEIISISKVVVKIIEKGIKIVIFNRVVVEKTFSLEMKTIENLTKMIEEEEEQVVIIIEMIEKDQEAKRDIKMIEEMTEEIIKTPDLEAEIDLDQEKIGFYLLNNYYNNILFKKQIIRRDKRDRSRSRDRDRDRNRKERGGDRDRRSRSHSRDRKRDRGGDNRDKKRGILIFHLKSITK